MARPLTILFLALLSVSSASYAQRQSCSSSQAERAETQAGKVRSWDALYACYAIPARRNSRAFRRFHR